VLLGERGRRGPRQRGDAGEGESEDGRANEDDTIHVEHLGLESARYGRAIPMGPSFDVMSTA
jgi:hypothetical protein